MSTHQHCEWNCGSTDCDAPFLGLEKRDKPEGIQLWLDGITVKNGPFWHLRWRIKKAWYRLRGIRLYA